MKNLLLLACLIALSACGSTGITNQSLFGQPIPAHSARLIITRSNDLMYFGAAANVSVNSEKIASLSMGGSVVYDVHAGRNLISVATPTAFGNFSTRFEAKPNKTYSFVVSPRSEALWLGSAWGMVGDAINASITENTGYFQVAPAGVK